ncbi:MAG: hypothetical protein ACKV2T_28615 [Kofleriaceae bacterium]
MYRKDHGVVSFNQDDQLSETNRNEIKAYGEERPDDTFADSLINKEDWYPLLTHQMKWVVDVVDEMLGEGRDLYALGVGTGFELRLLLRRRSFERVFASDISPMATSLNARALKEFSGELGLFASSFELAPIKKYPGSIGLVFQALHHAPDAHAALESLLDHCFDHLVIVEPLTNPLFKILARYDLVQRVEYSGTRPDWIALPRVEDIAAKRGYRVASRTWWEVPPYFSPKWLNERPWLWRPFYRFVDGFSRATNVASFGSMGAIKLSRS